MSKNNLLKIQDFGQSIWLDYIDREMIQSGELKGLIKEDGLRGVTSNPSIFDQAIEGSEAYEESIRALKDLGVEKIGVSHCTGVNAAFRLRQEFGDRYFYGSVGSVFEI